MTDRINESSRITLFTSQPPTPAPGEPGTIGEQFLTVALSLHYGDQHGTPAARQWDRARREVLGVGR